MTDLPADLSPWLTVRRHQPLAMAILAIIALTLGLTTPAHATDYVMKGRVLAAYTAAGGEAKLGLPTEPEQKAMIGGRSFYWQHTETGLPTWSRLSGYRTAIYPASIHIGGVVNDRDALSRSSAGDRKLRAGWVFRSAKLCGVSSYGKEAITAQLGARGTIIDLRTSGAASSCPDPTLPGITKVRYSISSSAANDYPRYVTDSAIRASVGKAIKRVAADVSQGRRVLIHCTAGKDRTCWTVVVLMSILGADQGDIVAEYMRSGDVSEADLMDALDTVATRYGGTEWDGITWEGMRGYVQAIGVTDTEIAQIQQALAA